MKKPFLLTVLLVGIATQALSENEVLTCNTIDAYWLQLSKPPEKETEHLSVRTFISISDDTLAINYSNGPAEILKNHFIEELIDGGTADHRAFIGRTSNDRITVIVLEGDRCQSGNNGITTWYMDIDMGR